jgi:DNA uptake protein ComE-like DNA-binding protein
VNTAGVKDLIATLELSSEEAGEIVEFREKRGKFNNWDDLVKVPKLEAKKLESKKDRVTFWATHDPGDPW